MDAAFIYIKDIKYKKKPRVLSPGFIFLLSNQLDTSFEREAMHIEGITS